MEINSALEEIGLTGSEIKVYLALIKIGQATKGPIVTTSKIAASKIYEVLDKLMDKGLVSVIIKNNVRNYEAAPLERIRDYLKEKKEKIAREEKLMDNLIPLLANMQKDKGQTSAEIFNGWKGIENVYASLIDKMRRGDKAYILGASTGINVERTKDFFYKYARISKERGIYTKIIFNENSRVYVKEMEKEAKIKFNKKFSSKNTNMEIAINSNAVGIVILKEEPTVILIKDKETAESFIAYFNMLWDIAKE